MSDEQLKQAIHQIADKDIGDDMNRWDAIYAKLDLPKSRPVRRWSRSAAILVFLLVGVIVTGVSAYVFRQFMLPDDGLNMIQDMGLTEEINQSQTIDGVTVTLERGYADDNRLVIWMYIQGLNLPDARVFGEVFVPTLSYGEGESRHVLAYNSSQRMAGNTFYHELQFSPKDPLPDDGLLDLRLELQRNTASLYAIPWGMEPRKFHFTDEYKIEVNFPDSVVFDFSLSVFGDLITLEPMQTIEANGMSMTVQKLRIAPSVTRLNACYIPPSEDELWTPYMTMRFDDGEIVPMRWGVVKWVEKLGVRMVCIKGNFPIAYVEQARILEIQITREYDDLRATQDGEWIFRIELPE